MALSVKFQDEMVYQPTSKSVRWMEIAEEKLQRLLLLTLLLLTLLLILLLTLRC